ncbi:unnamed protein product [Trichobilharzia szidati]|nr:unnamed protein product [Trichobilharzia szidati]
MMTSSGCRSRSNSTTTGGGGPGGVVVCDTGNNNNTNSSSTFTNNMKQQQQTMKRPTSSISLLADQLKLSSLNEQDPCSTTMRMMSMMTTKPVGQYDLSCDCLETINEVRNAYSMPSTHSHIGIQSSKRNNNINDNNNHTTIGNTDWTRSAASGGSTSKDYHHHSRTVHFRDIFTPSSSVCSSLQSTMSEFDDGGNEMTNPDHNSCCVHVLSASAPTTNYSLNSMSNLSKCNETTSCHHNVITNSNNNNNIATTTITNTMNNSIPSSSCTFNNLFSSSFPCSKDKIDIAHHHHHHHSSCTASKTMCSSLSSSSNCCGCCCCCSCSSSSNIGVSGSSGIGGGSSNSFTTFCPTCYCSCSCYVCRINNQSQHPVTAAAAASSTLSSSSQYCLPAKRACRSTSSSSDLPYYTSSLLSSSSSVCGYYYHHRQCHLPQRHCHQCCPKSIIHNSNNNNATMIRSMHSYIKNLPRPIAVRLDSQMMMAYNTKSKSCTNMDHVKSLNPINNNSNNNDDDDIDSNSSTLRNNNNNSNNNNGVILRPKPSDFMSFNKTGNGSRLSWHHPLFSFSSVGSQVKYNNTNNSSNNNNNNNNNNAISNPSTIPNDTSSGDSQLMSADNSQPPVQKSIRLRNHTTRANEQQQRTTSVRPPNYIEIKELQDSSLSAHALPSPSSAFTPTRASFGSFPIDVNSSSFSLSPATGGSISSSVQMTARTPSSGFHEASFSGLSEASSLPDCSRFGVPSDSMPNTNYCHCQCHQHQRPHLHHHHPHHDHHHRHHHNHHHHHHSGRKHHGKMSIDDKKFSSNLYTQSSNQLTDLEPCFKLEENEFNMNNDNNTKNNNEGLHQTMRNISSSGSNSSNSSNDSNSSSCSLQSMKCTLRCCSQPNDNTIYDNMNCKHLIHCSNNNHNNNNDSHISRQNNYRSLCTPLACTSLTPTTTNIISSNNDNNNNNNQSTPSSAMTTTGLKRRRGPSGECTECFDEVHDNNSHEEEKEQIHDDIFPCGCYYWKRSTDQVPSNNDDHLRNISSALLNTTLNDNNNNNTSSNCRLSTTVCCSCHELQHSLFSFSEHYPPTSIFSSTSSSYSSRHLCMPETCVHQDDPTLIEADFTNNTDGNRDDEQNTSTLIKRCTHSNTMHPINVDYNDSNSNNNNTETIRDYCPMELINPSHTGSHEDTIKCNPCNIVNYGQECEYSSGVFLDDSFTHNHHHQHQHSHRYACSELGKLSEMIEDEKEHETPETMIDEGGVGSVCSSNHVSEVSWHHPEIPLTSPPSIHDITFTPICPPSPQLLSTGIPVHNPQHDTDDATGRQVILFTPSPIDGSNSDGESDDMETILSPQMPNRQRIFSDIPINELNNSSNNNDNNNNISGNDNNNNNSSKQISSSFIDLDLELIEND